MFRIIVGFPKLEDATNIKNVLVRYGYEVSEPCSLGSQVISLANNLDGGIVVCGYRFTDMHYSELNDYLPRGFEMLLVATPQKLEYCQDNNIVCLPMPVKTQDLLHTLQMMMYRYHQKKKKEKEKPKIRSLEEQSVIRKAKLVLMERNNMTEAEAHRYLQKCSMDSQTSLVEVSLMVLQMY